MWVMYAVMYAVAAVNFGRLLHQVGCITVENRFAFYLGCAVWPAMLLTLPPDFGPYKP